MMVEPDFPDLTEIRCIPYCYHSTVTGKFITTNLCFGIRLDTNYYFSLEDYLGEENNIRKFLKNYMESHKNE